MLSSYANIFSEQMLGTEQEILVSGFSKKANGLLAGRTFNNRVVNFSGKNAMIGNMVSVKITEVLPNSLRGELI